MTRQPSTRPAEPCPYCAVNPEHKDRHIRGEPLNEPAAILDGRLMSRGLQAYRDLLRDALAVERLIGESKATLFYGAEAAAPAGLDEEVLDSIFEEHFQLTARLDPRINGTVEREMEGLDPDIPDQLAKRGEVMDRHEWNHTIMVGQRMANRILRDKARALLRQRQRGGAMSDRYYPDPTIPNLTRQPSTRTAEQRTDLNTVRTYLIRSTEPSMGPTYDEAIAALERIGDAEAAAPAG